MKAIIIIAAMLLLVVALKVLDTLTSGKRINSVGARANNSSKRMPRIDIYDPESIKEGIAYYKDLED